MPVIHESATTKDDILATRPQGFINYAIDTEGKRRSQVISELQERYPNASKRSIDAAYDHVISARAAGRAAQRQGNTVTHAMSSMPSNPSQASRVLYTVRISWSNPETGETYYHTTIIPSSVPLSNDSLFQMAYDQAIQVEGIRRVKRRTDYPEISSSQDVSYQIVSVEKR